MKKQMKVLLLPVIAFALAAAGRLTAYGEACPYDYEEFPLERNGIALHLDCVKAENRSPAGQILLVHGSTYSSHEFDIDYQDYSLVRRLAREGYAVWRLDIAGYGQSGPVKDGFMPDTAYAAEDIHAAVEKIVQISGEDKIDVLGWSWGTMTAGRFSAEHPDHLGKLAKGRHPHRPVASEGIRDAVLQAAPRASDIAVTRLTYIGRICFAYFKRESVFKYSKSDAHLLDAHGAVHGILIAVGPVRIADVYFLMELSENNIHLRQTEKKQHLSDVVDSCVNEHAVSGHSLILIALRQTGCGAVDMRAPAPERF